MTKPGNNVREIASKSRKLQKILARLPVFFATNLSGFVLGAVIMVFALGFTPLEAALRIINQDGGRETTVDTSAAFRDAFSGMHTMECEANFDFAMLLDNSADYQGETIVSNVPFLGDAVENVFEGFHNLLSEDSAVFAVYGEYEIVTPFKPGNGFKIDVDDEEKTATVTISKFILAGANGDPSVIARVGGILTLLSFEDPLFEQANQEAAKQLEQRIANGEGKWFEDCAKRLSEDWEALGYNFGYDLAVVVERPSFPLEVDLDYGQEPQTLTSLTLDLKRKAEERSIP